MTFVSYAQNREDVVLRRALQDVERGRYVAMTGGIEAHEVRRAFDAIGWQEGSVGDSDVHFLAVDLSALGVGHVDPIDLDAWRPWVVVVESAVGLHDAAASEAFEGRILASGYDFALFDGRSRFYVAREQSELRAPLLSHGACLFDDYRTVEEIEAEQSLAGLEAQVVRWRRAALETWATASAEAHMGAQHEVQRLRRRLAEVRERVGKLRQQNELLTVQVAHLNSRRVAPKVKKAAKVALGRSR